MSHLAAILSNDPNIQSYWPVRLPDRDAIREAKWMLKRGMTGGEIEYRTGLNSDRIYSLRHNPEQWSLIVDEVAITRALDGDRTVLPHLTRYERLELLERLTAMYEAEPGRSSNQQETHWTTELAMKWGVDPKKFRERLSARVRRRAAA